MGWVIVALIALLVLINVSIIIAIFCRTVRKNLKRKAAKKNVTNQIIKMHSKYKLKGLIDNATQIVLGKLSDVMKIFEQDEEISEQLQISEIDMEEEEEKVYEKSKVGEDEKKANFVNSFFQKSTEDL